MNRKAMSSAEFDQANAVKAPHPICKTPMATNPNTNRSLLVVLRAVKGEKHANTKHIRLTRNCLSWR